MYTKMNTEYFICECEYQMKLCRICEIVEEADKKEYVKVNVKRWRNRKITTTKMSK